MTPFRENAIISNFWHLIWEKLMSGLLRYKTDQQMDQQMDITTEEDNYNEPHPINLGSKMCSFLDFPQYPLFH